MIIEYGHIYVDDIDNDTVDVEGIKTSIQIASERKQADSVMIVLIDDKAYNLTEDQKNHYAFFVNTLYADLGLCPDKVFFEKQFAQHAEEFVRCLPSEVLARETFRKQNKVVTFLKTGQRKIPLVSAKENELSYSCQLLSSLWRKFKGEELARMNNQVETLTILDKKYFQVEQDVESLSALYSNDHGVKHMYHWY